MKNLHNFSERLNYLRKLNNITQKDIINDTGISLRMYQYYENGQKEITLNNLISLANYFNVSLDYLVGRTNNPKINK